MACNLVRLDIWYEKHRWDSQLVNGPDSVGSIPREGGIIEPLGMQFLKIP